MSKVPCLTANKNFLMMNISQQLDLQLEKKLTRPLTDSTKLCIYHSRILSNS